MRFPLVSDSVRRRAKSAIAAAICATLFMPVAGAAGLDWSASGRLLAFWCDSGLYCANTVQGGVVRLTSGPRPGRCSPDGLQVAWSESSGTYVWRADAAGAIRIAEAGRVAGWSPDSKWVVVESSPPGHAPEIYAASTEGKGVVPLAPHPAWDGAATCSPDGSWIAFVSERDAVRRDIWVVGWDGSRLTRVTSMYEAAEPSWSPDGSKLAFSGKATASSARHIYYLDFRTRKLVCLTTEESSDWRAPRFVTPNHVVYVGRRYQVADLRRGVTREMPRGGLAPNGQMVAVLSARPGALDVVALSGGARRSIDKAVEAYAWSPDGRWLAYLALAAGPAGVAVRELRINTLDAGGVYALWSEGLRRPGDA